MYKIPIIYEDNHLLVVEKPPNLLSQGDRTGDPDILNLLKEDIKTRYNKPGKVYLGLIHRLDRPVGGTMVFAKTSKAASRLSQQIREREFEKTYLAIVYGEVLKDKDRLVHYLLKNNRNNIVSTVAKGTKGAKEAILDYELIETTDQYSLVKINLHTGRPHQIRVQFSTIGHPLYGDRLYGPKTDTRSKNIGLWSYEIRCTHPTIRDKRTFISFPKEEMPWDNFKLISG
mgnify:CR=1 FL=1